VAFLSCIFLAERVMLYLFNILSSFSFRFYCSSYSSITSRFCNSISDPSCIWRTWNYCWGCSFKRQENRCTARYLQ